MSYGFHRLPPGSKVSDYITSVSGRVIIVPEKLQVMLALTPMVLDIDSPKLTTGQVPQKNMAKAQGYSGNTCTSCGGSRLKRAGHCEVCDDCGTTTGCS